MNLASFDELPNLAAELWWLWGGLILMTAFLLGLLGTRWGHSRPLQKCAILSLFSHVLLAAYCTQVTVSTPGEEPEERIVRITQVDLTAEQWDQPSSETSAPGPLDPAQRPWDQFTVMGPGRVPEVELSRPKIATLEMPKVSREARPGMIEELQAAMPLTVPAATSIDLPEAVLPMPSVDPLVSPVPAPSQASPEMAPPPVKATPEILEEGPQIQVRGLPSKAPALPLPERIQREEPVAAPRPDLPLSTQATKRPEAKVFDSPSEAERSRPADAVPAVEPVPQPELPREAARADIGPSEPGSENSLVTEMIEESRTKNPETTSEPVEPSATLAVRSVQSLSISRPKFTPTEDANAVEPVAAEVQPATSALSIRTLNAESTDRRTLTPTTAAEMYRLRLDPNRSQILEKLGGSHRTEAAVQAALAWLAANQSSDGRWDAVRHGAGREMNVGGRNRISAGVGADTGVTGLALLAFLGAGHTHRQGAYPETVQKGIRFLLRSQAEDGNLGGQATLFAYMYCHAMSTFALSECYAMTGDPELEPAVRKAVQYTLRAQNLHDGGWRYRPGDKGDTSVLGWQVMALKSAELAGMSLPRPNREGMGQFLERVSGGLHGGLASYRPGEAPARAMTAEALVCRAFLNFPRTDLSNDEAADFLLQELPGRGDPNYYYWYYGTLAANRLQGPVWTRWNAALTDTLLRSQQESGPWAGSWDPSDVWGGHGGRVYSTALGALCLEVYYRFLPVHAEVAPLRN